MSKVKNKDDGSGKMSAARARALAACRQPLTATRLPSAKVPRSIPSPLPVTDEVMQKCLEKLAEIRSAAG